MHPYSSIDKTAAWKKIHFVLLVRSDFHMTYRPYSSIDTTAAWKKLHFILSVRSDLHMTDNLSIVVHAFASRVFMSFSVDEILLPRRMNLSTSFRELPFCGKMSPLWLKHMCSILSALSWRLMPAAARSRICGRVSDWVGVFARSTVFGVIRVHNCLSGVSYASFLCQLETVIFYFINICPKYIG